MPFGNPGGYGPFNNGPFNNKTGGFFPQIPISGPGSMKRPPVSTTGPVGQMPPGFPGVPQMPQGNPQFMPSNVQMIADQIRGQREKKHEPGREPSRERPAMGGFNFGQEMIQPPMNTINRPAMGGLGFRPMGDPRMI